MVKTETHGDMSDSSRFSDWLEKWDDFDALNDQRSPEYSQRLDQWIALDTRINEGATEAGGLGIEVGINDVVVGMCATLGGYYTQMSCEGHDDEFEGRNAYPWVGFNVASDKREQQLA